ncbi:NAD+ synthase [Marinilabiliaceae bacterium ANBcel2]|nr:NAD+ synthase [Marinilabiliaceae bacterium ANBcel2]
MQPLKITLAQLNYKIGDISYNKEKIINTIKNGEIEKSDLIIFSELAICGYPPMDLLTKQSFIDEINSALQDIANHCKTTTALIGAPSLNPDKKGKQLLNSAWMLNNGEAKAVVHKTLLPDYDVFDEYRYFQPNKTFKIVPFKGHRLAITICEDIWDDQPTKNNFERNHLYTLSPTQKLAALKPDMLINISASPFSKERYKIREKIIGEKASRYNTPLYFVNQTGANTDLIFDGGSMTVNNRGEVTNSLGYFKERCVTISSNEVNSPVKKEQANKKKRYPKEWFIYNALITGVKDYFVKSGFKKAVIGLSGGLDSALTAVIAADALGCENVHGILLPSQYSSEHSIKDAKDLIENLGITGEEVNIEKIFSSVNSALYKTFENCDEDVTEENIQARIRGTLLMAYSNKFGHILLNTSNKSEAAVGYGTLYGDMNGGLSVLGDLYKSEAFTLADYINREEIRIPVNTLKKPPSAELRPNQKDSDSLPNYNTLDKILYLYIEENRDLNSIIKEGFEKETVEKVINLVNKSEYKRYQTAPVLRISEKAFGAGRRVPIVATLKP